VATALPELRAALDIPLTWLSWTQTAYLVPEIIAVALSGWAGRLLSHGRLFALGAAGFTLASIGCATSGGVVTLIIWRSLQGVCGGFLIPTVFTVGERLFAGPSAPRAMAVAGGAAMLAPAFGPLVAGCIVEWLDWRWLFLINVLPGIVVVATVARTVRVEPPDPTALRDFEATAFVSMVAFLVALELLLKEGPPRGWSGLLIASLAAIILVSGAGIWLRCASKRSAILELCLLADVRFALACGASFVLGIGLFGGAYLLPLFLGFVRQHEPIEIGRTVMVTGMAQLVAAPAAAWLQARIPGNRGNVLVAMAGFVCFALGAVLNADQSVTTDFWALLAPQLLRGVAVMFCLLPITAMALDHQPPDDLGSASALFNLLRNLGGAVGIAVCGAILNARTNFHFDAIASHLTPTNVPMQRLIAGVSSRYAAMPGAADAGHVAALKQLWALAYREASTLAFADAFRAIMVAFAVATLLVPLLRNVMTTAPRPAPTDAH
jgi:DHA2 family multidrug resistance protein